MAAASVILAILFASPAIGNSGGVLVSGTITDHTTGAPMSGVLVEAVPDSDVTGARGNNATTDTNGHFAFTVAPGRYELDALAPTTGARASYYEQDFGAPPGYSDPSDLVTVSANGSSVFNWSLYPNDLPYAGALLPQPRWTHVPGQPFSSMSLNIASTSYAATPFTWPTDTLVTRVTDKWGDLLGHAVMTIGPGGGSGSDATGEAINGCGWAVGTRRPGRHVGHPVIRDLAEVTVKAYLRSDPTVSSVASVGVDRSQCFQTRLTGGFVGGRVTRDNAPVIFDVHDRAPGGMGIDGWLTFSVRNKTRRVYVPMVRDSVTGVSWADLDLAPFKLLHIGSNILRVSFTPRDSSYARPHMLTIRVRVRQ